MKKIFYVLLLLCLGTSVFAFDFDFSREVEQSMKNVSGEKTKLEEVLGSKDMVKVSEIYKRNLESFTKNRVRLQNNFPTMEQEAGILSFTNRIPLEGTARENDIQRFKEIAEKFVLTSFPDVVGADEKLLIMHVMEDCGADQEKLDDGSISPEVNQKSYSFTVRIGRIYLGKPVFNSLASIEIDAVQGKVVAFDLTNWMPIPPLAKDSLKNMDPAYLTKLIAQRMKSQQLPENENVRQVTVQDIRLGWLFDDDGSGSLAPAFIHYGDAEEIDQNKLLVKKRYCFVERLSDIAKPGKSEDNVPQIINLDKVDEKQPAVKDDDKEK